MNENENENAHERTRRKPLSLKEKWSIVAYSNFFRNKETGKFDDGTQNEVLTKFKITKSTLLRILDYYDSQDSKIKDLAHLLVYRCSTDEQR